MEENEFETLFEEVGQDLGRLLEERGLLDAAPSRSLSLPSPEGSGMQAIAPCKQSADAEDLAVLLKSLKAEHEDRERLEERLQAWEAQLLADLRAAFKA